MLENSDILNGIRVATLTLGCKVNQYETEAIRELLEEAGAVLVEPDGAADVCIVNTCSVTNMAERKSRQMLHRVRKMNPQSLIVAVGCYVQRVPEEVTRDSAVDLILGNNCKKDIVAAVAGALNHCALDDCVLDGCSSCVDIGQTKEYEPLSIRRSGEHTRAHIKIQDGCNQFCTYCIIPYVRGRIRSRKEEDILSEVRALAESGTKEIVLTGIHVSSYGLDRALEAADAADNPYETAMQRGFDGTHLLQLIHKIAEVPEIKRIRLSSLEPRIMTEEFVRELAGIEKVCPHFHLSLQSACNETLRRMNRKYTIEEYMTVVARLRKYYDRPAITTDVIVGFPGETDTEFRITKAHLEELQLYQMHIFQYSKRQGTIAAKMQGQVPDKVKRERSEELLALTALNRERYEESFVGQDVEVLFEEGETRDGNKVYRGHTTRYMEVFYASDEDLVNCLVTVPYRRE